MRPLKTQINMSKNIKSISKFLSLVLRHKPETVPINLDENGWADVEILLETINKNHFPIDFSTLEEVVASNNKQRFTFNKARTHLRANQGHSISVDLDLIPAEPPTLLYHGTATRFLDSIKTSGLLSQSRQHVHLSHERETAISVGQRHGKAIVLEIFAEAMHKNGLQFVRSKNGVWLTDHVPVKYIKF